MTMMEFGFIIMNKHNITHNIVNEDNAGYWVESFTSDSYLTYVNVVDNNGSSQEINFQLHFYYIDQLY